MARIRITPPPPTVAPYDVVVEPGAVHRLAALLSESALAQMYAIIADAGVRALAARVSRILRDAGLATSVLEVASGEEHKTRETWAQLTDRLLASGAGRDTCIVAVGGGATSDIAGFVAATYMRGVPVVHVPTTLLAMVDAAVGGKTGVDTPQGKNLVGAFHQPRVVIMDPETLDSLPVDELRAGAAEAVKHGAIADAAYLRRIAAHADAILRGDLETMTWLVERSVEIKASFVSADPYEQGARAALNFGHTIGHALEAAAGYGIRHGFAVAIGMVAEARIGEAAGITERGTALEVAAALEALGLPTRAPSDTDAASLLGFARTDKKARAGLIRYTLLRRLGEVARAADGAWTFAIDDAEALRTLASDAPFVV